MDIALLQTVLVGAVNLAFTVLAIWLVDRVGRKPLMIFGAGGMGICLTAIGVASMTQTIGSWLLCFMLGYIACFAISVGPVTWVILSEIFPTRVRGRALAVATFFLWVANFAVSQTYPMMAENPYLVEKFHNGFPFLVYAVFCAVLVGVIIGLVPETKGRTLEEIERMWMK
jgi:SP family xylose:H+ symportor-like MFS transporter